MVILKWYLAIMVGLFTVISLTMEMDNRERFSLAMVFMPMLAYLVLTW